MPRKEGMIRPGSRGWALEMEGRLALLMAMPMGMMDASQVAEGILK